MTLSTSTMERAHDELMDDAPSLPAKPERRKFTAAYKLAILDTAFPAFVGSRQPRARKLDRWPWAEFCPATDQLFQGKRPRPGFGLEKHRVANVRPLHAKHQIGALQVALEELSAQLVWERDASLRQDGGHLGRPLTTAC